MSSPETQQPSPRELKVELAIMKHTLVTSEQDLEGFDHTTNIGDKKVWLEIYLKALKAGPIYRKNRNVRGEVIAELETNDEYKDEYKRVVQKSLEQEGEWMKRIRENADILEETKEEIERISDWVKAAIDLNDQEKKG